MQHFLATCLALVVLQGRDAIAAEGRVEIAFDGAVTSESSKVNEYSISSSPTNYFQNEFCTQAWPRSNTKSYCKLTCPGLTASTSAYVKLVKGGWNTALNGLDLTYPQGKPQGHAPSVDTLFGHMGPYKSSYAKSSPECPLWSSHTESAAYSFWVWVPLANRSEVNAECADCYYPFYQGAKMPGGLCAGGCYTGEDTEDLSCELGATCDTISKEKDGSTLRLMWRRQGRLAAYVAKMAPYCEKDDTGNWKQPDQYLFVEKDNLGGTWLRTPLTSSELPGATGVLQDGQWNYLEVSLSLNSCSSDGGCADDGKLEVKHIASDKPSPDVAALAPRVLTRNDVRWRCLQTTSIDSFIFQTFMGGSASSWAPTVDTTWTYYNFSTWRVLPESIIM